MNKNEFIENRLNINRRHFMGKMAAGIGGLALGSLLVPDLFRGSADDAEGLPLGIAHFAPKAKRVIYLFQNGAPHNTKVLSTNLYSTKWLVKNYLTLFVWGNA
jgi:hypothetical protein